MARGYGWRCDNCGDTVIETVDIGPLFARQPPQGWFMVHRDLGVRREEGVAPDQEWHLCSSQCLDIWSLNRRKGEVEDG